MARLDKAAFRYAKAIFDTQKNGSTAEMRELTSELSAFVEIIEGNKELQHVFSTRIFSSVERRGIVEDLTKKAKVSKRAKEILIVLAEMRRLGSLGAIVERLNRLVLESSSIVPLRVETAAPLTADQREKIEGRFAKVLGKKVEANYVSDPALIGGLKVTAEGRTFDGSVSGWLTAFGEQLAEATV